MRHILKYLKPFSRRLTFNMILKVFATVIELALPRILSYILNEIISPLEGQADVDTKAKALEIALYAVLMIVCAALGVAGSIKANRVSAEIKRLKAEGHVIDDIGEEGMTAEIMDQIETALKADRQDAIASVSVLAAEAPLMVMEDSLSALRLAATMKGRSNRMLESDIYVAALSLSSGIRSANLNVDANLPAIEKADPEIASSMRLRVARILAETDTIISGLLS